jgi:hypothetical protein
MEADRVADGIMARGTAKPAWSLSKMGIRAPLQRKCACGESGGSGVECEECKKKEMTLQRRAANQPEPATVPPIVHEVLRSPGQPVDLPTRAFMEPRLGHDFSKVRMHTDAAAGESAQTMNALAYTVGRHVVFGSNRYQPGTESGRSLLAHELVHTIQQEACDVPVFGELKVTDPTDATEIAADRAARPVTRGLALADAPSRGSHPSGRAVVARQILDPDREPDPGCDAAHPYRIAPKAGSGRGDFAVVPACSSFPIPVQKEPEKTQEQKEPEKTQEQKVPEKTQEQKVPEKTQEQKVPEKTQESSGTPKEPSDDYDSRFEDDPLSAGGFGDSDQTIRVRPGPVRTTLIRPNPRMTDIDGYAFVDDRRPHSHQIYDAGAWLQGFLQFFDLEPVLDPLPTGPALSQKYMFRRASRQRFFSLTEAVDTIIQQGAFDGQTITRDMALSAIIGRIQLSKPPGPSTSRAAFYLGVSAVRTGHLDTSTGKFARPDRPGLQQAVQLTWEIHKENESGPEFSWIGQVTEFPDAPGGPWKLQSAYTGFQAAWVFAFLEGSLQIGPIVQALGGISRGQQAADAVIKMVPTGQVALGEQMVYEIPGTKGHLQIGGQFAAAFTAPGGAHSTVDFAESIILQWKF